MLSALAPTNACLEKRGAVSCRSLNARIEEVTENPTLQAPQGESRRWGSIRVAHRSVLFKVSLSKSERRDCLDAVAPDDDAQSDPTDEPAQIGHIVCPEVGIEGMAYLFWDVRRVVLHAETLQKVATDSSSQSAQGHNDQKLEQLRKEIVSRDSWT
jgi:hypothetical protein